MSVSSTQPPSRVYYRIFCPRRCPSRCPSLDTVVNVVKANVEPSMCTIAGGASLYFTPELANLTAISNIFKGLLLFMSENKDRLPDSLRNNLMSKKVLSELDNLGGGLTIGLQDDPDGFFAAAASLSTMLGIYCHETNRLSDCLENWFTSLDSQVKLEIIGIIRDFLVTSAASGIGNAVSGMGGIKSVEQGVADGAGMALASFVVSAPALASAIVAASRAGAGAASSSGAPAPTPGAPAAGSPAAGAPTPADGARGASIAFPVKVKYIQDAIVSADTTINNINNKNRIYQGITREISTKLQAIKKEGTGIENMSDEDLDKKIDNINNLLHDVDQLAEKLSPLLEDIEDLNINDDTAIDHINQTNVNDLITAHNDINNKIKAGNLTINPNTQKAEAIMGFLLCKAGKVKVLIGAYKNVDLADITMDMSTLLKQTSLVLKAKT